MEHSEAASAATNVPGCKHRELCGESMVYFTAYIESVDKYDTSVGRLPYISACKVICAYKSTPNLKAEKCPKFCIHS